MTRKISAHKISYFNVSQLDDSFLMNCEFLEGYRIPNRKLKDDTSAIFFLGCVGGDVNH